MSLVRVGSTLMPGPIVEATRDRAQVLALRARRLGADQLVDQRRVVLEQRALVEARSCRSACGRSRCGRCGTRPCRPSTPRRPCATSIVTVPTFGLGILPCGPSTRPSRPTDRHHVRRRDRDVEVGEALLDALGEVLGADDVGAGLLGLLGLVALGEDRDLDLLAETVGKRDRAAQLLVGVADVQARCDVNLDGLVELGALEVLDELIASAGAYSRSRSTCSRASSTSCRAWPSAPPPRPSTERCRR